ncbi:FadR/GntR family transcriptional regulator [Pseudonocardia ammonioxydans]|nr:FCD domain-containing protein [Pseudonocardia ammonioxydans]
MPRAELRSSCRELRRPAPGRATASAHRQPGDTTGFTGHLDFHTTVLMATGNLMITMMGQPVADVLRTRLLQAAADSADSSEWDRVDDDHRRIAEHIAAGDGDGAEAAMRQHINDLRSLYQRASCW